MPSPVCDFRLALTSDRAADACCTALTRLPDEAPLVEEVVGGIDHDSLQQRCVVLANHIHHALPPDFLRELGRELARLLFPPAVRNVLSAILWQQPEAVVRLWLQATPEWDGFPWEYAYLEADGKAWERSEFLGLHPRLQMIRQWADARSVNSTPAPPVVCAPLKVLLVWADPASSVYPRLPGLAEETRALQAALHAPECRGAQVETLRSATREGLRRALHEQQPHVLHFLGHGDSLPSGGVLILERGQAGGEERLYGDELADWLAGTSVRLVVLSACRTASLHGVTQTLAEKRIAAVVGMQLPMRDSTAASFARAFYGALVGSGMVDEALQQARQALRAAEPDWGVPVLYLAETSGHLFTLAPQADIAPPPPSRPFFTNLPYLQNPHFTGRDIDLRALHLLFQARRNVAVVGMGGMGKTQLVVEYAHKHLNAYPGGIFWINARDSTRMKESYAELSRHFGVPETLTLDERAQRMWSMLQEDAPPTLVIYDNVTEETDSALLPKVGSCRLLATTRDGGRVRPLFKALTLKTLGESASLALLETGREISEATERAAAERIAALVGHLPLALALIAHHVHRLNVPFRDYYQRLQQGPLAMLDRARNKFIAVTQHDGSLYDTLDLSYRSLSAAAQQALTTAACFAPRGISPALLSLACRELEAYDCSDALADLKDYSLLTREQDERITLHELVRVFAQEQMPPDTRRERLVRVCETLAPPLERAEEAMEWQPVRLDAEHCPAVAELCRANQVQAGLDRLLRAQGAFALAHGEFAEASSCFAESLRLFDARLGHRSVEVANGLMKLAEVKYWQGGGEEMLRLAEEALAIAEKVYAPDALELAQMVNDMGAFLERQGRYEEALVYIEKGLTLFEARCGHRNPKVAMCLNNIGNVYESQGNLAEALEKCNEALLVVRALYGSKNEQVAIHLNNIGRMLARQGQYEDALTRHQEALEIYEAKYGRQHRGVGTSLFYSAEAQSNLHQIEAATHNYRKALSLFERFFGSENQRCVTVRERLDALSEQ